MEVVSDKPTATKAVLPQRRWTDYNKQDSKGAGFEVIHNDLSMLPDAVQAALLIQRRNVGGLTPDGNIRWNVSVMTADGGSVIDSKLLKGGAKTGNGCGEDALWVTEQPGNIKGKAPDDNGNAFFNYNQAVYVIDAGLCPCHRCCGSFIGLSKELKAFIVVRPMVDYEFIAQSKTTLELDPEEGKQTYFLLFKPDAPKFTIFYEDDKYRPAHLQSTVKPVSTKVVQGYACDKAAHFALVDHGTTACDTSVRFKCTTGHCKGTLVARELTGIEKNKAKSFARDKMTVTT